MVTIFSGTYTVIITAQLLGCRLLKNINLNKKEMKSADWYLGDEGKSNL